MKTVTVKIKDLLDSELKRRLFQAKLKELQVEAGEKEKEKEKRK